MSRSRKSKLSTATLNVSSCGDSGNQIDRKQQNWRRIIVDQDAGIDDAWALFMLLQAHQEPSVLVNIEGITCVAGNTTVDNVAVNITRVLQTVNEKNIPVYRGAESALTIPWYEDPPYFGDDGFGDADLPPIIADYEDEHAVDALIRILDQSRGQITILALGPLTNLALAIRKNPKIHAYPQEILLLGGNTEGVGNVSTSAEFNFMFDAEAARTVLESFTCPITIVPIETLQKFGMMTKKFRVEQLGSINTLKMQLLNKIEAKIIEDSEEWTAADALATAVLLNPLIVKREEASYCTVELNGSFTRGMMVVDRDSFLEKPPNASVILEVDLAIFEQMLIKTAYD